MNELAFSLANVQKSYKHFQLRGINLELPRGRIMGFVGPNGAGKPPRFVSSWASSVTTTAKLSC